MPPFLVLLSSLSLCFVLIAGCGDPAPPKREFADVKGKVIYKGEALKKGTVTFQPDSGAAVVADIQADGTYSLKGVVGENTVMVVNREPDPGPGSADPEKRKAAMEAAAAAAAANSNSDMIVPPEYATPASPLKFQVKAGANTADFDIK